MASNNIKSTELIGTGGKYVPGLRLVGKTTRINVPDIAPEKYDIPGFIFSRRFLEAAKLKKLRIPETDAEWKALNRYVALAKQIESDSDGGPTIGANWIKIWIDNQHPNAGSKADYIWMYFGRTHRIKLLGVNGTEFPKGWWLSWDLNQVSGYLESIPTDKWDEISLVSDSGDGIKIDRIKIVHSDVCILDWNCNLWLDNSKLEKFGKLGLVAKILSKKLGWVGNTWVPQIHWAARELGKTDGFKYGQGSAWCSEFASWCLRKALWDTPTGSIGSQSMENYFNGLGRKYTGAQVLDKKYVLTPGDYLRMFDGGHSGLFVRYIDRSATPTAETRIKTIEGNTGKAVRVRTRKLKDLTSVGNTR